MNEFETSNQTELSENTCDLEEVSSETTEDAKEIKSESNEDIAEESPHEESAEKRFGEYTVDELYELAKEHPDEDVMTDIMSEPFKLFVRQKSGSMNDTYSEYLAIKKAFSKEAPARGKSGQDDNRSHSGFGDAPARDISSGLTRRQMEIARNAGMSYREYAFLLESLPDKRIR